MGNSSHPFDIRNASSFTATGAVPAGNAHPTYAPGPNTTELIRTVHVNLTVSTSSALFALEMYLSGTLICRSRGWNTTGTTLGADFFFFDSGMPIITTNGIGNQAPLPKDLLLTDADMLTTIFASNPITWQFSAITVSGIRWLSP